MLCFVVCNAHGQENTATEEPLRAAYYTCLKASKGATLALNDCIGTEYDFQDQRLNTAYKSLRQSISSAERNALRDQERAWMSDRDDACAPPANGGTAAMLGANECRLTRTAHRAAELEARTSPLRVSAKLATEPYQIPTNLRSLFTTQDTILALKSAQQPGEGDDGAVVLIRHPVHDGQQTNPCELVVLRNDGGHFVASDRNSRIVECTSSEELKHASALGLNSSLTVTSNEIIYFNQLARGGTTYSFAWSKEKAAWHLQHVETTSVQNGDAGVVVYKSVLDYPSSLSWISLTDFDPKLIRESVARNRKVVE
jgi:uncharacterized protein YecT (DUF1311 family)